MIAMITPSITVAVTSATGGSGRMRLSATRAGAAAAARGRAREAMTVSPQDVWEGRISVTGKSFYHLATWSTSRIAHEVIKRVGRRAYRYRVESYRDPETLERRKRWTYLGVAESTTADESGTVPRAAATESRRRLLDAFERLAERMPYPAITASAISTEAGLAHGTFYRYFRDKRAIFTFAIERLREDLARMAPSFAPPYGSRDAERMRVRRWVAMTFAGKLEFPGVLHAYFQEIESDEALREERQLRRRDRILRLATYLEALIAANTISALDPVPTATALASLIEATFRNAFVTRSPVEASVVGGVMDVVDRAIFEAGPAGPSASFEAIAASANGIASAVRTASVGTVATETRAPESYVK
jgi:AcrR family transcriptional regulator